MRSTRHPSTSLRSTIRQAINEAATSSDVGVALDDAIADIFADALLRSQQTLRQWDLGDCRVDRNIKRTGAVLQFAVNTPNGQRIYDVRVRGRRST